jgi:hypothetical protein
MSLVELAIVIGILGVIFAAVFLFFTKGMQQFHFSRRQNELATAGRLALEQIADEVIWAGYLPHGGIDGDLWHPVENTDPGSFSFYADYEAPWGQVEDSEHRNVLLGADGFVYITDNGSMQRRLGHNIISLQFEYLSETGSVFTQPLSLQDRDAVRHIRVRLVLQDTYMGNVYQTSVRTTISPRNLGVYRDIDPSFIPPPPLEGNVVMNVAGQPDSLAPTAGEYTMILLMEYWGLKVIPLADDALPSYDYVSNEIDLVILRDVTGGDSLYHSGMSAALQAIPCPVICLDADDASLVYSMGLTPVSTSLYQTCFKVVHDHQIHKFPYEIPSAQPDADTFEMFPGPGVMNYLLDLSLETTNITSIDSIPGDVPALVCVRDEFLPVRRVLYGLPSANTYSSDGIDFFYNVLYWALGGSGGGGTPGDPITAEENFEGESGQSTNVVLWEDDLNNPQIMPDSIPIHSDDFAAKALGWTMIPLGPMGSVSVVDETLRMQRLDFGAETRNVAGTVMDMTGYSAWVDDIYLKVATLTGSLETVGLNDGVFFIDLSGTPRVLLTEDFNSVFLAPGDVTFWGDLYGRSRIHSPDGWQGDGGFATLDSRTDNTYGRVRMMIEVPTTGLGSNTEFTVNYRFHDHGDLDHSYDPAAESGDFIGWNSTGVIEGPVTPVADLNPESYSDDQWYERSTTFSISGTPPNPLYIVFGQYDNGRATSFTGNRGISLDNVVVIAGASDTLYTRIGTPSSDPGWNTLALDLSAALRNHGMEFDDSLGVVLSQSGTGPWNTHGISWDDFEVGIIEQILTIPGWSHGFFPGGVDDWSVRQNPSNPLDFMWSLFANNPSSYSNNSDCWLTTPEFSVPLEAVDPELSFRHALSMQAGVDYGYVQVSVSGGPWTDLGPESGLAYSHTVSGRSVFSGSRGWFMEHVNLDPYKGESVRFRFVFVSDAGVTQTGWFLDDFLAECTINGYEITEIAFKKTWVPEYTFGQLDVYLGATDLTSFPTGGMLNTESMFHAYSGPYTLDNLEEWQTISLSPSYFLPAGMNLVVKVRTVQPPLGPSGNFVHGEITNACRSAQSLSSPPTYLNLMGTRPALRVNIGGKTVMIHDDGTQFSQNVPMTFLYNYGDCEAIYTGEDMELGSGVTWTSGGTGNDWEIGAPLFFPAVDPALLPSNLNMVAGTDLTTDGYYNNNAWAWFASSGYPMEDAAVYDTVSVRFFRCLRLATNDLAHVQLAFGTDPEQLPAEGDWITVRTYNGFYDNNWQYETINLTQHFNDHPSYLCYYIRFVLDSGVFGVRGGWNLDNIQFFGRTTGGK